MNHQNVFDEGGNEVFTNNSKSYISDNCNYNLHHKNWGNPLFWHKAKIILLGHDTNWHHMCHFGYRVTPWWVKLIKFLAKQYSDFKKIMVVCEFTSAIYTIENCHILTFKVNFQCKESPECFWKTASFKNSNLGEIVSLLCRFLLTIPTNFDPPKKKSP